MIFSHVSRSDLLSPLIKAKLVLRFGCPFFMQLLPRNQLLNNQHLLHQLIDLNSLTLRPGHILPDGKGLFLPHKYSIPHHLFQKQELGLCPAVFLHFIFVLTAVELLFFEFGEDLPLRKDCLHAPVII